MTSCAWQLRDGSRCRGVALVDGLCPSHFEMRQALEAEDEGRAARGEPAMSDRQRDRFLKARRRARKAKSVRMRVPSSVERFDLGGG